jgi:hypothetical protein
MPPKRRRNSAGLNSVTSQETVHFNYYVLCSSFPYVTTVLVLFVLQLLRGTLRD